MRGRVKIKNVMLVGFVTCVLGFACWLRGTHSNLHAASNTSLYAVLLNELKLTDDPRLPSMLIEDDSYRNRIQTSFLNESVGLQCDAIQTALTVVKPDLGVENILVEFRVPKLNVRLYGMLSVPTTPGRYPLVVYNNSGFGSAFDLSEARTVFATSFKKLVIATPLFAGETFHFEDRTFVSEGGRRSYVNEVDRAQALTNCLQRKSGELTLASGEKLIERLIPGPDRVGGVKTVMAGSGRGGLIAALQMARSGAGLLGGATGEAYWNRVDCGVLVNPLYNFYAAEARLQLAALVRGDTEETKYVKIPGLTELRYELFRPLRAHTLSVQDAAFELARRDAFVVSPFINLALKNYSLDNNTKGVRAGALFIGHGNQRTDFSINSSRIFANVLANVEFKLTEQTNGMNFLYREFREDEDDAVLSYEQIFSPSLLRNAGHAISNDFISVSDSLKGQDKFYRWIIRGRAFENSERLSLADSITEMLYQSCSLP